MNNLIVQIELVTIAVLSLVIAIEFYKSQDGRLRIIIIELFASKVWLYGGVAVYYAWLHGKVSIMLYLEVLLTPMFVVMVQLYLYIRNKNKS